MTDTPHDRVAVNKAELARMLGISSRHVDKLRKQGLPTAQLGRRVVFRISAVEAWLAELERAAPRCQRDTHQ